MSNKFFLFIGWLILAVGISACGTTSPAATVPTAAPASATVKPTDAPPATVAATIAATATQQAPTETPTASSPAGSVSFSEDINPVLQANCFNCHGGEKTSRGLSVATYETLMKGSQNGAVINPGNPDSSKLLQSILSGKMPKKGEKLTADEAQLIKQWILEGAQNN